MNQMLVSGKTCNKCRNEKSLLEFERRPDTRNGYRSTCKDCRRTAKNATNRRWYDSHREQEQQKLRIRRAENPEHYRLINARYHWTNREQRNANSREYYRQHRERLIEAAIERRKRNKSLDFGWAFGAGHDAVQYQIWQRASSGVVELNDLFLSLTDDEFQHCVEFLENDTPIPSGVLASIRCKFLS